MEAYSEYLHWRKHVGQNNTETHNKFNNSSNIPEPSEDTQ